VHPIDLWGDAYVNSDMPKAYSDLLQKLDSNRQGMIQDGSILNALEESIVRGRKAVTPYSTGMIPCQLYEQAKAAGTTTPSLMDQLPTGKTCEDGLHALHTWENVKSWEIFQKYKLEDVAPTVYASGEKYSWLGQFAHVFELAPHRSAINSSNFMYQDSLVGKYSTTSWYQLQLTLNAGNRRGYIFHPVDWNYQPDFIGYLHTAANGPMHPLRYIASHTKMFQQFNDGDDLTTTSMGFKQLQIHRYAPGRAHGKLLDSLPQPLRTDAYKALLNTTMDLLEQYAPEDWERSNSPSIGNLDKTLEPTDYILTDKAISRNDLEGKCFEPDYANCWYSSIPYFKEAGVDEATINRLVDWGKAIWPAPENNWDALR
ncbi:MAG: hypothetical protein ACRCYY_05890, partial [Trueperaceae bacterium]